jgi:hypothetical protein
MSTVYVYGVAGARPSRLGRGLARERLRVIRGRGFVVIAGGMDDAPGPEPDALRAHDAVVRRLSRVCPAFLPARFGWMAHADELAAALAPHRAALVEALKEVRGCVQMIVRVFGDTTRAEREQEPPRGRGAAVGTEYMQARARAWREAESLPELDPLRARLAGVLRAERQERHGAAGLVGTAYHLVERGRLRTYRARVRSTSPRLAPLRVQLSGPWAPYAFGPRSLA